MKKIVFYLLISGLLFNLSCKKEESASTPEALDIPNGIIKSCSIIDGQQNVGVYDTIMVFPNYMMNSHVTLSGGQLITINVESIKLTHKGDSIPVDVKLFANYIRICHEAPFKDNGEPYVLDIKFGIYQYKNSIQVPCETNSQTEFIYNFSTKSYDGAVAISASNIAQSYPAIDQYHYLPKESSEGFLTLKPSPQIYINTDRWEHFVKFYRKDVEIFSSSAQYDQATNTFTFNTPQDLSPETIYSYTLFQKPKDSQVQDQTTKVLQVYFRTSKYATFKDKWATFVSGTTSRIRVYPIHHAFKVDFTMGEELDAYESKWLNGLVRFSLDTSDFCYQYDKPIYEGLSASGYTINYGSRNPLIAIPPLNDLYVTGNVIYLTQQQIDDDNAPAFAVKPDNLYSYVYIDFYHDIDNILDQINQKAIKTDYDIMVWNIGDGQYESLEGSDADKFKNVHAQYYVGNKMTSDIKFNW